MLDCTTYDISHFPLFASLSNPVAEYLLSRGRERRYAQGEVICLQDEPAKSLKLVTKGWVKLYRVTESGAEAILATLELGSSFDEIAALRGGNSKMSAEAITDCTILHLDLNAICTCDGAHAEISSAVLSAACSKFDDLITQLEDLKVKTALQRLSGFLLDKTHDYADQADIELPYNLCVLAGQLGMQPESLSRAFKRLKSLGVENRGRNVCISDVSILRGFAEQKPTCT